MDTWQDRLIACSEGSQLGGVVRCALGRNEPGVHPAFIGKAVITSDGFIMCDFIDRDGNRHMGAFVGSVGDFERNVKGVADHLQLSDEDRAAWYAAARGWIGMNYARALRIG